MYMHLIYMQISYKLSELQLVHPTPDNPQTMLQSWGTPPPNDPGAENPRCKETSIVVKLANVRVCYHTSLNMNSVV